MPRHGTNHGYIAGCRCVECKRAHAEYQSAYRARLRKRKVPA